MVIFVFLGRATDTLIPAVALPLSLLLTFVAMKILGYSLDNLSLMALTLAIGFLVDDAIVFLENTVRLMEEGQTALEASLNSAKEISFTILTMTLSLAAVFIPLVFMGGLVGRIFREFSITIVISILASGLVSLTLTPLMTSRLLSGRGAGTKKTLVERVIGAIERRVLGAYGRQLWFFLRHRWISVVIWLICLFGTGYFFYIIPKSFLPVGDSSFIRGVLIAQEGSSPEQMHAYQDQAEKVMHANPAVAATFTMSGNSQFLAANQAFLISFLKDPSQRAPIQQVAGQLMGGVMSTVPGALVFMQPNPVLEISTGATANVQGQFAYALSGIDSKVVYDSANKMLAKMQELPRFPVRELRFVQPHAKFASGHLARAGQALRCFRNTDSDAAARCLLAELQLPDQKGHRSIPGDPGSGGRRAVRSAGFVEAIYQERRRATHGAALGGYDRGIRSSARKPSITSTSSPASPCSST